MGCGTSVNSFTQAKTQEELLQMIIKEKNTYESTLFELSQREYESKVNANNNFTEKDKLLKSVYDLFIRGICSVQIELKIKDYNDIFELCRMLDYYFLLIHEKNEDNISKKQEEILCWLDKNVKK